MTQTPISAEQALHILQGFGHIYAMEADSLRYLMTEGKAITCYASDGVLTFTYTDKGIEYITVIPRAASFVFDELLLLLRGTAAGTNMLVNMQLLDADCASRLNQTVTEHFAYERTVKDYIHTADVARHPTDIKLLTAADREAFLACTTETFPNRPPLFVLFDLFVNKGHGYILGAYEEGRLIAYLSFTSLSDSLYDVDFIYVVGEKRGRNYGKLLGEAYVQYAHEHGCAAYWSNAKNEASERTARACGFTPIREARKYVKLSYT